MKHKVVDHWSLNGFNIVTEAKFKRRGITLTERGRHVKEDSVHIRTIIYNPFTGKLKTYDDGYVHEYERGTKKKWYHKWKYETVTIAQAYEEKMQKIYDDNLFHVQALSENQLITDGLPGSLKNL